MPGAAEPFGRAGANQHFSVIEPANRAGTRAAGAATTRTAGQDQRAGQEGDGQIASPGSRLSSPVALDERHSGVAHLADE